MAVGVAEKFFKVTGQRSRSFSIIIYKLYNHKLYSYSLKGAISCVQMCECYTSGGVHSDAVAPRICLSPCSIYEYGTTFTVLISPLLF